MPNVTLHMVLADRVLERWERTPSNAPFDTADPGARNAFFQGSFGPDIGYFPGGDVFLSDLAHYVRAGDLTRALVRSAGTERERAYAWGWLTHVLGDQAIHPLVGEAAAELGTGRRGGFVGISEDRTAHVRIEVGLDAHFSERHPGLRDRRTTAVFDRRGVRFLAAAYREVYGLEIDGPLLLASHLAAVRMSNHALAAIGVLGSALTSAPRSGAPRGGRRVLERALAAVREGLGQESMVLAFLNLAPPSPWLVRAVESVVESFPDRFASYLGPGLGDLPNFNLDTGRIQVDGPGSACAERTHRTLERAGGSATPDAVRNGAPPARYSGVVDGAC